MGTAASGDVLGLLLWDVERHQLAGILGGTAVLHFSGGLERASRDAACSGFARGRRAEWRVSAVPLHPAAMALLRPRAHYLLGAGNPHARLAASSGREKP